jgi:pyruvate/2-oxoglutarate dehydrogenase complex dihydrolipoamide dehydrogenase (E3) component
MAIEDYEILVLGSGEAGKYLAWTMAKAGRKTAVIERKMIGGSCPNVACLPSKNIIHSAKVASYFRRGEEFGMSTESWHVDMERVRQRKRTMVDGLVQMHLGRYKDSGAELILGNGVFTGPKTIEVALLDGGTRTLRGEKVFLNTGTRAAMPEVPGLAESKPMTHVEALELAVAPEHLVILGAGYVGLELAQAIRRFGSRVTVIERGPRLAQREDEDISDALLDLMRDEGIEVLLNTKLTKVEGVSGDAVQLQLEEAGAKRNVAASHIFSGDGPRTQHSKYRA